MRPTKLITGKVPASLGLVAAFSLMAGGLVLATGNLELLTQTNTKVSQRLWNNASLPLGWRLHNPADPAIAATCNHNSPNGLAATLQPAHLAAFTTWQNDPDSLIAFTYLGNSAPTERNVGADGINLITFCDAGNLASDGGYIASTPTTALTTQFVVTAGGGCPPGQGILDVSGNPPPAGFCFPAGTYAPGTIIDADIRYNVFGANEQDYSTNLAIGTYDVQAIATHEIGHFFGLSHDPIFQAVMFPFVDDNPFSDTLGQRVLRRTDLSTVGYYHPAPSFGTTYGAITGFISLDGADADGVHVFAVDPVTMLGVAGRFSITRFQDSLSLSSEGADYAANGGGFYRISGLPPGNYYVHVEYFDNGDFFTGRSANRYNNTVANSNVSNGNGTSTGQGSGWLGFLPKLTEFYNTGDSGNGGDGNDPGTALDNSDAATLVPVVAGATTSNINIAINIEPVNGQTPANRQNPTTRSVLVNDAFASATDSGLVALLWDGGDDDYYAVRFPAASLPAPPFNVAEGLWVRGGRTLRPMVTGLALGPAGVTTPPALTDRVVPSAGRMLSGGPNGANITGDFVDVRDQWNVTVNTAKDVWIFLEQPEPPPAITFITEGYFVIVTRKPLPDPRYRVGNSRVTEDNGASWFTLYADVWYDLIVEQDPPVMVTSANPGSMLEGVTGNVDIGGFGFANGATVDFGPGVTVNSVTFSSAQLLQVNITTASTGATSSRPANVKVVNPGVVFPNVARLFTILPNLDGDGDGAPNASDCAPADATLKNPSTEVANLDAVDLGATTRVIWDSQDLLNGTGTIYDVVTGLAPDLRPGNGYAGAVCGVNDHGDSPFIAMNPVPALNTMRYWLARAWNGCNTAPGTYGNSDSTIMPDPRDALDAGAPCP